MSKQLSIEFSVVPNGLVLRQIKHGVPFKFTDADGVFMRVKPVNYLLNSSLITDCINRNKVMVVSLEKGTCFIAEGDRSVEILQAKLTIVGKGI